MSSLSKSSVDVILGKSGLPYVPSAEGLAWSAAWTRVKSLSYPSI
jgi:hypothetical protein